METIEKIIRDKRKYNYDDSIKGPPTATGMLSTWVSHPEVGIIIVMITITVVVFAEIVKRSQIRSSRNGH